MNTHFTSKDRRSRKSLKTTALAGALIAALTTFSSTAWADLDTGTFNAGGYTLQLPPNAVSVDVEVTGAGGGGGGSDMGGTGGRGGNSSVVKATIAVKGGEQVTAFVGQGGGPGARFNYAGQPSTIYLGGWGTPGVGKGSGGKGGGAGAYGNTQYSGAGGGGGGASIVSVGGASVQSGGGGGGGGGSWNQAGNDAANNAVAWATDPAGCGSPADGAAGVDSADNGGGGGAGGGGYSGAAGTGGTYGADRSNPSDTSTGKKSDGGTGGGSCVISSGSYAVSGATSMAAASAGLGGLGGDQPGSTSTTGVAGGDGHVKIAIKLGPPTVTVNCTPSSLSSGGAVATCTVTSNVPAPAGGLTIVVTPPATNPGYTTTCTSPMTIPAGQQTVSCEVKAPPTLTDAPSTATLTIQPSGTNYVVGTENTSSVTVSKTVPGSANPVPVNSPWALAILGAMMALFGLRRANKRRNAD